MVPVTNKMKQVKNTDFFKKMCMLKSKKSKVKSKNPTPIALSYRGGQIPKKVTPCDDRLSSFLSPSLCRPATYFYQSPRA